MCGPERTHGYPTADGTMLQFHIEIMANLVAGAILSVATIVSFSQAKRTRNNALGLLGVVSLLFGASIFLQATSYVLIDDSFDLAMIIKQVSVVLVAVSYVIMYAFLNYVWFERMRLVALIPVIVLAVLEIASIYFTEGLIPYTFFEGEELVATTIGKTGYLLVFETILGNGVVNVLILAYFTKSYMKAPPQLKRQVGRILAYVFIFVAAGIVVALVNRSIASGTLKLFMFGLAYLLVASAYVVIISLAVRNPKLLFILPFRVDRLLIIDNKSGLPLFDFQFSAQKIDEILFSGLIQGIQQMSIEVLQKGQITQINLDSGVLAFRKMRSFTAGLLASRNSQILERSFSAFTNAFEKRFNASVEAFNGDRGAFSTAEALVKEFFNYVPVTG